MILRSVIANQILLLESSAPSRWGRRRKTFACYHQPKRCGHVESVCRRRLLGWHESSHSILLRLGSHFSKVIWCHSRASLWYSPTFSRREKILGSSTAVYHHSSNRCSQNICIFRKPGICPCRRFGFSHTCGCLGFSVARRTRVSLMTRDSAADTLEAV